jgi:hypothetical protein
MTLDFLQALTEMSKRRFSVGKAKPGRKADNLIAICELCTRCGILNISQPYMLPRPVTETALLYCVTENQKMKPYGDMDIPLYIFLQ